MTYRMFFLSQILTLLCACNNSEDQYNKENKNNTTDVDYSTSMVLKHVISIKHEKSFEVYYSINTPRDTVSKQETLIIDSMVNKIADTLFDTEGDGGVVVVMKETLYTNKLKKDPEISDAMNPFERNNVYLVEYGYRHKRLVSKKINGKSEINQ